MKKSIKFDNLIEIYKKIEGGNRNEKYRIAENIYKNKYGSFCYDDFRLFNTKFAMMLNEGVPYESALSHYRK